MCVVVGEFDTNDDGSDLGKERSMSSKNGVVWALIIGIGQTVNVENLGFFF